MKIHSFTFNSFQENSYILYDDSKECIIFDPGCSNPAENKELADFITSAQLKPIRLINTHCHIDHILGNKFVSETYDLPLEAHEGEVTVLNSGVTVSQMYGIPYDESPPIAKYIEAGDIITLGDSQLEIHGSIGRTDLPGGDFNTLIKSIREQLFPLGDDVVVYPGHGPSTTIAFEKANNPFLQG